MKNYSTPLRNKLSSWNFLPPYTDCWATRSTARECKTVSATRKHMLGCQTPAPQRSLKGWLDDRQDERSQSGGTRVRQRMELSCQEDEKCPVVSTGVEGPDWLLDKLPWCWGAIQGPDKGRQMRSGLRRSIAFNLLLPEDLASDGETAFCKDV